MPAIAIPHSGQVANTLFRWINSQLDGSACDWLEKTIYQLLNDATELKLFSNFSAASRQVGKADLALTEADVQVANILRTGWTPLGWSVDQAVRTLLLLAYSVNEAETYVMGLEKLFSAADVAEQVALYQSLPLLPYPERFIERAVEGLRSNITTVFNAIALRTPFAADYFGEAAWNQMVLKALFVDSPLSQIQGLETRANHKLAKMLADYAHERWAAGRTVNPQLWRLLGLFATGELVFDLEQVLQQGQPFEQQAAALACASAPSPEAKGLLTMVPELQAQIVSGRLTWDIFSQNYA